MNSKKYRINLYEKLNSRDIAFIRHKGFSEYNKDIIDALKTLRYLGYDKDEDVERIKGVVNMGLSIESQTELLKRKGIKHNLDDINVINEEDYADEEGWF